MSRVTKDPDIRRQEIIDTAMQVFFEKGYEKTSMLDISQRMNVSQGLCYRYFKSKEEIYFAALDSYINEGVEYFKAAFCDDNKPLLSRLDSMASMGEVKHSLGDDFFNKADNSFFHMQMQIALCDKLFPIIVDELKRAQERKEITIENPESVAAFCLYGQLGVWVNTDMTSLEKVEEVRKLVRRLIT